MKLKQITIQGFKSFDQEGATIRFGDVTVLLGANGAGKSNVVSFFKMLNFIVNGVLQTYVAEEGFADSLLHYGGDKTKQIKGSVHANGSARSASYEFELSKLIADQLFFTKELYSGDSDDPKKLKGASLATSKETQLLRLDRSDLGWDNEEDDIEKKFLATIKVFHFHDTASIAKIRSRSYIHDNNELSSNGGNIGAFLYALKENPKYRWHYDRIVRQIRQAMPQFGDFVLLPDGANPNYIALNWRDNSLNPDYLFGPHQISDGSLRFIALATLLLQPKELLPKVIVLDEPELGLHPSALAYLAGMIGAASCSCQLVLATQSQRLVDEFDVENIVILERDSKRNATVASYKTEEELVDWLENYSLSELWEKNVIGGQP